MADQGYAAVSAGVKCNCSLTARQSFRQLKYCLGLKVIAQKCISLPLPAHCFMTQRWLRWHLAISSPFIINCKNKANSAALATVVWGLGWLQDYSLKGQFTQMTQMKKTNFFSGIHPCQWLFLCICLKAVYATFSTLMYPKSSMFYVNISSKKNFMKREWSQTPSVFVDLSPLFTSPCRRHVPVSCRFK